MAERDRRRGGGGRPCSGRGRGRVRHPERPQPPDLRRASGATAGSGPSPSATSRAPSAAADGYARTTGRLGVCLTSTGPGAANAMGGQLEACVSSSPVLHLTGPDRQPVPRPESAGSSTRFPTSSPCWRRCRRRPTALARPSCHRLHRRRGRRPGDGAPSRTGVGGDPDRLPVRVPRIAADASGGSSSAGRRTAEPATARRRSHAAAELIARVAAPHCVGGRRRRRRRRGRRGGRAGPPARGRACSRARTGGGSSPRTIPVASATSPGTPTSERCVARRTCSWRSGRAFRVRTPRTGRWSCPTRLVQIDVDPAVPGRNYPVEAAIVGDAKAVDRGPLGSSSTAWRVRRVLAEAGWAERVADDRGLGPGAASGDSRAPGRSPRRARPAVSSAATVVVKDSTIPAYTWGNRLLPVRRPRTSIMPNSFAIGLGLPHAIGAAVGSEGAPVVLLVGDGGFLLSATELATVAQEQLPIVDPRFRRRRLRGPPQHPSSASTGPRRAASASISAAPTSARSPRPSGSELNGWDRSTPLRLESSGPCRFGGPFSSRSTSMRSAR